MSAEDLQHISHKLSQLEREALDNGRKLALVSKKLNLNRWFEDDAVSFALQIGTKNVAVPLRAKYSSSGSNLMYFNDNAAVSHKGYCSLVLDLESQLKSLEKGNIILCENMNLLEPRYSLNHSQYMLPGSVYLTNDVQWNDFFASIKKEE